MWVGASRCAVVVSLVAGCAAQPVEHGGGQILDEVDVVPEEYLYEPKGPPPYVVPDLPTLVSPEVIVSLRGLTVHLFDRETGFSRVYPTGVGAVGANGKSVTPVGHFKTGPDTSDRWFYMTTRRYP